MSVLFYKKQIGKCWICGSEKNPTREHKIKQTEAKRLFRGEHLNLESWKNGDIVVKQVQGPKSDTLKFQTKICGRCNSDSTQKADKAFDGYMALLRTNQHLVANTFYQPELSLAQYFAKLIGCHLVEQRNAVIPKGLSKFIRDCKTKNRIWLRTTIRELVAGHSGANLSFVDPANKIPHSFGSTLIVDGFQHTFEYEFSVAERLDLILFNKEFLRKTKLNPQLDSAFWN